MQTDTALITVLIVDDHPSIRDICRVHINSANTCRVVGEAADGTEAIERLLELNPDVVLLDIRLPDSGPNGIEVAKEIKKTLPETKIVIFSAFSQALYVRRLIQIGVNGYITKDSPPEMVVEAIQTAYKGGATYSPEINAVLANHPTYTDSKLAGADLTQRELDVLQLLATGSENRDISSELSISNSSVQLHLTTIFGKLRAKNRTEAVIVAVKNGLVVIDE